MKLTIYSIHDSAISKYNNPFYLETDDQAKRIFAEQVNKDPKAAIFSSPHHFNLYRIGVYDMDTGLIEAEENPVHLLGAKDVVKTELGDLAEQKLEALFKQLVERLNDTARQG